ncbi:MAG: glucuronate isomerase [Bacteroidota bacterium]
MKPFLDEHFLLETKTAQDLYHQHAVDLPIIDYHNHLPPDEIADNKQFSTITEVWLKGDHYKWRAMRANGISEEYITGDASDRDKFTKWAETVPYTMRNPLYHWTHLELQRYFGIPHLLNKESAAKIYDTTTEQLQQPSFSTQQLLANKKVEVVCTTDDPTDSLEYHQAFQQQSAGFKMLPTFRPDKFLQIEKAAFPTMVKKLEAVTNKSIRTLLDLVEALQERIDFFHSLGGRLADHGLSRLYGVDFSEKEVDAIFQKRLRGEIYQGEAIQFQSALLYYLGRMYHAKGWTMQFHLGALRNNNERLLNAIGADVGCDSIGDFEQATGLSRFLNRLDKEDKLAKTILYNLNPRNNEVFATMAGNFNDGSMAGKIQWGSAWWFLDQKDGMEKQINALSNMGLLSRFLGMLTDSRSFLSFPRHEYFRRILCNLMGRDVENGELPNDVKWLGQMVENICYYNAKRYFEF